MCILWQFLQQYLRSIPVTPNNTGSLVTIGCFVRFLTWWLLRVEKLLWKYTFHQLQAYKNPPLSCHGGNSVRPLKQVQFYNVCIHWDFEVNLFSPSRVRFTSTQINHFWKNQRDHRQPTLLPWKLLNFIFNGARRLNLCVKSIQKNFITWFFEVFLIFMEFARAGEWQVGGYCLGPGAQNWAQRVPDSPL